MEKEKMKNSEALNLYDVFEKSSKIDVKFNKKQEIDGALADENNAYQSYQNDFLQIEKVLGLRKNLEFFFYKFLPLLIQNYILKNSHMTNSLDASKFTVISKFKLHYLSKEDNRKKEDKKIYYYDNSTEYILPYNHDDNNDFTGRNFAEFIMEFIWEYNLGTYVAKGDFFDRYEYYVDIYASVKDLIYACYVGQEWVKALEDDCVDLLSDYYSKEQLESFKKTLHKWAILGWRLNKKVIKLI